MSALREKLSWRDAALLAGALLLPIPLFAQSGLSIPLPSAVERGLGSFVTLDTNDPRTGSQATGQASTGRQAERLTGRGLRIVPAKGAAALLEDLNLPVPVFGSTDGFDRPAGDGRSGGGATPPGSGPEGAGGGPGSPGDSESPGAESPGTEGTAEGGSAPPTPGAGDNYAAAPASESVLTVSLTGPGSSSELSIGDGGVGIDLAADDSGAGSDETGAGVGLTQADGSSTSADMTLPGLGVLIP